MKTYTVRELDRRPGMVLEACDTYGSARIRCRDGRTYVIKPEEPVENTVIVLPDLAARRRKIFKKTASSSFVQKLDEAISGE